MGAGITINNYKLFLSDVSIAIYYANYDDFALPTYGQTLVLHVLMNPTCRTNSICVKYLKPLFNGLCKIAKKYANSDDFGNYVKLFFKKNNLIYIEKVRNSFVIDNQIPNIYNEMENLRKVIKEELTKTDKDDVERIVRKEIEKSLNGSNKKLEEAILEIVRNALIQMHKSFWVRRSFWTKDIKNRAS